MPYLIKSIGIIIAISGVVFATMPALATRLIEYLKIGKRLYAIGVLRALFGLLLLIATPQAALPWIVGVIGALMLLSAVILFFLGVERGVAFMNWWESKPEGARRIGAIVAAFLGVLLIYGA
ncbi:MAG: hypothetical protein WC683_08855 [bacterium]